MSPFSLFSSPGYSHFSSLLLKLKIIICSQFLKIFPLSSCCEEYKCSAMPSQREYNCQLGLTWPSTPGYPANLQYYPDTGYPAYLHYYPDTGYMAIFLPITNYFSVKNISFHFPLIHILFFFKNQLLSSRKFLAPVWKNQTAYLTGYRPASWISCRILWPYT